MYEFIKGELCAIGENYLAVEAGGIGYKIFATQRFLQQAKKGQQTTVYTYLVVREDELSLYGFQSLGERDMFLKLISVSGVGPKAGLAILSTLNTEEIARAILAADQKAFSRVSGVGPKTAARIVLELKDKVEVEDAILGSIAAETEGAGAVSDAVEALMGLGYQKAEAISAVSAVRELADTTEELTLLALKRLGM